MNPDRFRHIYGPVPSRRLGRSLGIDLVPFKTCTYDCVYCQLGRTTNKTVMRTDYVPVEEIQAELERKLTGGEIPDYITLAGSGEPTLNVGIGKLINWIKGFTDIPLAVITNGSLLWMSEVQDDLMGADLVLPSLDAGDDCLFQCINRPHGDITFKRMVDGIAAFRKRFPGMVWLEVLLLRGVTGIPAEVVKIASFISQIQPARVQLNTVSRPPAEEFAFPLSPEQMLSLKALFPGEVEIISGKEPDSGHVPAFAEAGDEEILALLMRRPSTSTDVADGLGIHVTEALKRLEAMIAAGKVKTVGAGGRNFYTVQARDKHSRF